MAQTTHTRTAGKPADVKKGRPWGAILTVVLVVALIAVGLFLLFGPRSSAPTPPPAPAPSSAATTAATPTAEQQAYTSAQNVLNAWISSYQTAYATLDSSKLDPNLATSEVLGAAKANLEHVAGPGITGKYVSDIQTVMPMSYTPTKVEFAVCALRYVRFFQDGKDVTVDQNGKPSPPATAPLMQVAGFTMTDNGWKISSFQLDTEAGARC